MKHEKAHYSRQQEHDQLAAFYKFKNCKVNLTQTQQNRTTCYQYINKPSGDLLPLFTSSSFLSRMYVQRNTASLYARTQQGTAMTKLMNGKQFSKSK